MRRQLIIAILACAAVVQFRHLDGQPHAEPLYRHAAPGPHAHARVREPGAGKNRPVLVRYEKQLGALACLVTNFFNTIRYQHEMRRIRAMQTESYPSADLGLPPVSREPIELRDMAQAEIDNIEELIALLESSDAPLIEVAATPQEEDHMSYHPDLIGQLRGKIATMQAHWNEYDDPLDLFSGPEDERA